MLVSPFVIHKTIYLKKDKNLSTKQYFSYNHYLQSTIITCQNKEKSKLQWSEDRATILASFQISINSLLLLTPPPQLFFKLANFLFAIFDSVANLI